MFSPFPLPSSEPVSLRSGCTLRSGNTILSTDTCRSTSVSPCLSSSICSHHPVRTLSLYLSISLSLVLSSSPPSLLKPPADVSLFALCIFRERRERRERSRDWQRRVHSFASSCSARTLEAHAPLSHARNTPTLIPVTLGGTRSDETGATGSRGCPAVPPVARHREHGSARAAPERVYPRVCDVKRRRKWQLAATGMGRPHASRSYWSIIYTAAAACALPACSSSTRRRRSARLSYQRFSASDVRSSRFPIENIPDV